MSDAGNRPPLPPSSPPPSRPPPPPASPQQRRFYFQSAFGEVQGPYAITELRSFVHARQLKATSLVCQEGGEVWIPASQVPGLWSERSFLTAVVLSALVGWLGIDRFYLGYTGLGVLKLLTGGGCGLWWLIDLILIATRKVTDAEGFTLVSNS